VNLIIGWKKERWKLVIDASVRGFDGEHSVIFYEFFLELGIRHNPISFGGESYVISYGFF
jgi:hypothetical protein